MEYGKVYLVPTPIGNLKDITLRALEVLENVDEIAAEDTRQSLKLLNHFNIKKPLFSYHQHNEQGKSDEILSKLESGKNIAIVTDAGTPGISDPGSVIVKKCIENNISFEVLPGATAITTALVYSGLDTTKFIFRGFIPRETKERKILTEELKLGKAEILKEGKDITIVAIGKRVAKAMEMAEKLKQNEIDAEVINARFLKPLDKEKIKTSIEKTKNVITMEDGTEINGLGTAREFPCKQ